MIYCDPIQLNPEEVDLFQDLEEHMVPFWLHMGIWMLEPWFDSNPDLNLSNVQSDTQGRKYLFLPKSWIVI